MLKLALDLAKVILICSLGIACARADDARTLVFDGSKRTYVVRAPASLPKDGTRVPLVLVFHGGGGNAENAERMTGFTQRARERGFIVVYPEGSGRTRLRTWNAGHCCGYAMKQRVDDVGFVNALIDELIRNYPIDTRRIYATGMSNGAMMSHRIGIELSHRVAAIAPVVGAIFGDEKQPAQPVSALIINGLLDKHVPPDGGQSGGPGANAWDGTPARPVVDQATFWAEANGCKRTPVVREDAKRIERTYSCPAGQDVKLVLLKDSGHAWPGGRRGSRMGDKPSTSMDATDVILEFFVAHPKKKHR
jgi:polyhydroxybutyrate depolymerase